MRMSRLRRWSGVAALALPVVAMAGPVTEVESPVLSEREPTLGERIENLGLLHRDPENPLLQEWWLLGRFHGQVYDTEGGPTEDDGYETRRLRLGTQLRLLEKLTLHAQAVAGPDLEPVYNGFTELWAMWSFRPEFSIAVGQQKHRFTHDRNASSRYINHLERAQLTNMFNADYTPAVTIQGKLEKLNYYTGVFSNATGENMEEAFTDLNSGWSFLAAAYFDVADWLGTDTAFLHSSFIHSEANENATNLNRYENGLSGALILTQGPFSWVSEVTTGTGFDGTSAVGFNLQPGFFITDELQAVMRYQVAFSDGDRGLVPQRRYERGAGLPRGDLYQAGYVGLNYYIARHRVKVMTGLEYATMGDKHVWTASAMFRFYFGPHSGGAFPMNTLLHGTFFPHD